MIFSTTILNRVVATSMVTTSVALSPIFGAIAQAETLNGAGATFPAPLYERYAREVKKKYPDLKINYQAIGSGGGIRQVTAGTVDFGGSDAAMKDDEIAKVKNGVILVPTAGGAVSVVYNLPGLMILNCPAVHYQQFSQVKLPNGMTQKLKLIIRVSIYQVNQLNLLFAPMVAVQLSFLLTT